MVQDKKPELWWSSLERYVPDWAMEYVERFDEIVMYKPPVGIVTMYVFLRLIWTGRIFTVYKTRVGSVEGVLKQEGKKKRRTRRYALTMDSDDQSYDVYGGVERTRRRLCTSALSRLSKQHELPQQADAAMEALSVSYKPGNPRYNFVEEISGPLSRLEQELVRTDTTTTLGEDEAFQDTATDLILKMSVKTAEIRALDALLRLARDNLLTTSLRLNRNRKHWQRRVAINDDVGWMFERLMSATIEGDRMRHSFASAAYKGEIARLGSIQQILMERPDDMTDKTLLDSIIKSRNMTAAELAEQAKGSQSSKLKLPKLSRYSLRYNAEGRGRFSLRVHDGDTTIRDDVAWDALVKNKDFDPDAWLEEAQNWTEEARLRLCNVLRDAIETSMTNSNNDKTRDDQEIIESWCSFDSETSRDLHKQWLAVLDLVDNLESVKHVGEGRTVTLSETSLIKFWAQRVNVFGIPSALLMISFANIVHNVVVPYWPKLNKMRIESSQILWTIFKQRFWIPFYGIIQGLMNKDPGLLEAFDIDNEEQSLDNMLKNCGFGDGTAATRKDALQKASRHYENYIKSGIFSGVVKGGLPRLMLVQVQQLKAGLLHAMASIDVLIDANRLNMQILAAIPAVLIVLIGTRLIYRSLFTIKTKTIRSVKGVHAEMAEYLDEMEIDFLLAAPPVNATVGQDVNESQVESVTTIATILPSTQLGEFVLHVHSYLTLLDYCSPLLPRRATRAIHKAVQEMVASHTLGIDRQIALLRLVKQKHMELLKYLKSY